MAERSASSGTNEIWTSFMLPLWIWPKTTPAGHHQPSGHWTAEPEGRDGAAPERVPGPPQRQDGAGHRDRRLQVWSETPSLHISAASLSCLTFLWTPTGNSWREKRPTSTRGCRSARPATPTSPPEPQPGRPGAARGRKMAPPKRAWRRAARTRMKQTSTPTEPPKSTGWTSTRTNQGCNN